MTGKAYAALVEDGVFVPQTTPFTCGAAAGLMALRLAGVVAEMPWVDEFQIWREANSIFMGAGQAGCEPDALAAALARRGATIRLWERFTADLFDAWTRSQDARTVIKLIREADRAEAERIGVEFLERPFSWPTFQDHVAEGWVPVVLIRDGRALHWVTVRAVDDDSVEILDPYVNGSPRDRQSAPNLRRISTEMARKSFTHRRGTAHAVIFVRRADAR